MIAPYDPQDPASQQAKPADARTLKQRAAAFQAEQALTAAVLIQDVIGLFSGLMPQSRDVRQAWPPIRGAIARIIRERHAQSAISAAHFYQETRVLAQAPGEFEPVMPRVLSDLRVLGTLDATGPWQMLGSIGSGMSVAQAAQKASVTVAGAAGYLALSGGRDTITGSVQADPQALAWARQTTSAHPCAFCSMLASRGAVYKTEKSAGFRAHNHCACVPVPLFSKEDIKLMRDNDLYLQWQKVTQGYGGKDALNAWRRYWDKQAA
jgi:hypothetical protein